MTVNLRALLEEMIEKQASDLHITAAERPKLRIDGDITDSSVPEVLNGKDTLQLAYSVLTENQKKRFETEDELDFSFGIQNLARFRGNVFKQRGCVAMVIRMIPFNVRTFQELGLPPVIAKLAERPRGLILVTGPTGSGKDVILVGEMRDLETIAAALTIAETGHLALATLHTNSAAESINRIIDVFPHNQQSQVRAQLAFVLEGVVTQTLLPKAKGRGRAMAAEIMVATPAIRALIRDEKIHQIYSAMQSGKKFGMQTMNDALYQLYVAREVTDEECLRVSGDPNEFLRMIGQKPQEDQDISANGEKPLRAAGATRR